MLISPISFGKVSLKKTTFPKPEPTPTPVPIEDTRKIIGFYDGPDDCGPIYDKM